MHVTVVDEKNLFIESFYGESTDKEKITESLLLKRDFDMEYAKFIYSEDAIYTYWDRSIGETDYAVASYFVDKNNDLQIVIFDITWEEYEMLCNNEFYIAQLMKDCKPFKMYASTTLSYFVSDNEDYPVNIFNNVV